MRRTPTDFYLNLDRWDALSLLERQRGRWEARLDGPPHRWEQIQRDALAEAAWGLVAPGRSPARRAIRAVLASAPPGEEEPPWVRGAWRYCHAAELLHGWHAAFQWTDLEIGQVARVLENPPGEATTHAASVLRFLREKSLEVHQSLQGPAPMRMAAIYGGFRHVYMSDPAHPHLYLLGFRLALIQEGFHQARLAPIETIWIRQAEGRSQTILPPWEDPEGDIETRLGLWLDELVALLLEAGEWAEEAWRRSGVLTSRSSLQEGILLLARRQGRVTAGDVLKETGANRNTVKDNLARLVRTGHLRREGSKRGTVYLPV